MSPRTREAGDEAQLVIRRLRGGELRACVDGKQLMGVKSTQIECVGFGAACFVLRISGSRVRLDDEVKGEGS